MDRRLIASIFGLFVVAACGGGGGGSSPPPPPINVAPVASAQNVVTDPGTALSGTLQATDADGDALTYAIGASPASGVVVLSGAGNQSFEYTPNGGFTGTDSFTFNARDFVATSPVATVMIEVNARPVASAANFFTSDLGVLTGSLTASDTEGDAYTFAVDVQPSKGTITSIDVATGDFVYTPEKQEAGLDLFGVTASDAYQTSAPVTINVDIVAWPNDLQYGTTAREFSATGGMFFDASGNLITGGATEGQIGATPNAGDADAWVRKVDRQGAEVWTTQFGNTEQNFARIVAPIPGTDNILVLMPSNTTNTASIVKLDTDGNILSNVPVDFETQTTRLVAAYWGGVDPNGDVIVLSWISGNSSLITKVNGLSGATEWQLPMIGTLELSGTPFNNDWALVRLRGVDFDAAGNAIIAGWYTPDTGVARVCETCPFIASYDPDGNQNWLVEADQFAKACTTNSDGLIYRVMVAPDQTLWAAGHGSSEDSQNGVGFGQVSKFSADGTQLLWSDCDNSSTAGTNFFGFTPVRFASNGDGLVLTMNRTNDDPINGVTRFADLRVSRLMPDGNIVFRRTLSTTNASGAFADLEAGDIVEDEHGVIYVSGGTDGEWTQAPAIGDFDAILFRLTADGESDE